MTSKFPGVYYQFTEDDILPDGTISDKVPIFVKVLYLKGKLGIQFYSNATPSFTENKETGDKNSPVFGYGDSGDYIIQFDEYYSTGVDEFYIVSKEIIDRTFGNLPEVLHYGWGKRLLSYRLWIRILAYRKWLHT